MKEVLVSHQGLTSNVAFDTLALWRGCRGLVDILRAL